MPSALEARAPHVPHPAPAHHLAPAPHPRPRLLAEPRGATSAQDLPALPPGLDGVAVVAWPEDAAERGLLAAAGRPRILVVAADAAPPVCWDDQEDWIRLPATGEDLAARASGILGRGGRADGAAPPAGPVLDADGLLRNGDDWVALPPIEARLLARLLEEPGSAVAREALLLAGWPDGSADHQNLGGRVKLLRRRIARLGVEIHTVRGVGYLVASR